MKVFARSAVSRSASRFRGLALSAVLGVLACAPGKPSAQPTPLILEGRISLGAVKGRIDHLAFDQARERLFVAELGNGTVGVVDLRRGSAATPITGLSEPQGISLVEATDTLYVANGGDGSVRLFSGSDFTQSGRIDLGGDADNVRIDPGSGQIVVGYGSGGLAVIDTTTRAVVARIPLPVHPESFQFDPVGSTIFVNLPGEHQIAIVDRKTGRQLGRLAVEASFANFPMAMNQWTRRIAVVFRLPAELRIYSAGNRSLVAKVGVCHDADDVFFDARRDRIYVICGEGVVDVVEPGPGGYVRAARIITEPGARTGIWAPQTDRLYVAAPARNGTGAQILILRPTP